MEEQHKKKKTGSAKKTAPNGIKDRKSVSEQKKKAQRAERIPERKKSNWDDGEFLDDWDEVCMQKIVLITACTKSVHQETGS